MKRKHIVNTLLIIISIIFMYQSIYNQVNHKFLESLKGQIYCTSAAMSSKELLIDTILLEGKIEEHEISELENTFRIMHWSLDRINYQLNWNYDKRKYDKKAQEYKLKLENYEPGIIKVNEIENLEGMRNLIIEFRSNVDKLHQTEDKNVMEIVESILYYE